MNFNLELDSFKKGFMLILKQWDLTLLYLAILLPNILIKNFLPFYWNIQILYYVLGLINIVLVLFRFIFRYYVVQLFETRILQSKINPVQEFVTTVRRLLLPLILFYILTNVIDIALISLTNNLYLYQHTAQQRVLTVWSYLYSFLIILLFSISPIYFMIERVSFWSSLKKSYLFLIKHPSLLLIISVVTFGIRFLPLNQLFDGPILRIIPAIIESFVDLGILISLLIYYLKEKRIN